MKMKLYVNNGKVLVWNFEDALKLQKEHRIVGSYIGSFHRQTFQHKENTLPLLLLPEEATLLRDKGIAELVWNSRIGGKPDASEIESFKKSRENLVEQQMKILIENKKRNLEMKSNTWKGTRRGIRKKKVLQNKATKAARKRTLSEGDECDLSAIEPSPKKLPKDKGLNISCGDESCQLICDADNSAASVSCASLPESDMSVKPDKVYEGMRNEVMSKELEVPQDLSVNSSRMCEKVSKESNSEKDFHSEEQDSTEIKLLIDEQNANGICEVQLENAGQSVCDGEKQSNFKELFCFVNIQQFRECPWKDRSKDQVSSWSFPYTEREKLRYAVFCDLWQKGYYLTPGTKFGGDFLVYLGDPHLYHSMFIVFCISQEERFTGLDLTVLGRMGNQVNKTSILASVAEGSSVQYISLSWNNSIV